MESLPAREMLRFAFGNKRPPHINVGEMRSRRALWRTLAQDPRAHGRRHLGGYESSATVGSILIKARYIRPVIFEQTHCRDELTQRPSDLRIWPF